MKHCTHKAVVKQWACFSREVTANILQTDHDETMCPVDIRKQSWCHVENHGLSRMNDETDNLQSGLQYPVGESGTTVLDHAWFDRLASGFMNMKFLAKWTHYSLCNEKSPSAVYWHSCPALEWCLELQAHFCCSMGNNTAVDVLAVNYRALRFHLFTCACQAFNVVHSKLACRHFR